MRSTTATARPARPRRGSSAPDGDATTRDRLLEAAARTIADRGFAGATVREICRRARANVAAVNYHFGSKAALEVAAARWTAERIHAHGVPAAIPGRDARERLRSVLRAIAAVVLGRREEWETRFMMRALAETPPSLDAVVREFIEPKVRMLESVLAELLPGAPPRTLRLTAISAVSQLVYHRLAGPVALRLLGERAYGDDLVAEVVAHVVAFTERAVAGAVPAAAPKGGRP